MRFTNSTHHREKNRRHWSQTLDPQNLGEGGGAIPLERQLELALTADVREALQFLEPLPRRTILDLGGGLGLHAVLLARRGARVIVADLSPERLKEARRTAEHFAVSDRVWFVACAAEELPFQDGVLNRQLTKSVLIHTELPVASSELARTLAPGGRACFIEPLAGNPFVRLYRKLAAPRIWQEITRYFSSERVATVITSFERSGARSRIDFLYFFAFFATPLNYSLHNPRLYRIAEEYLLFLDRILLKLLPLLRFFTWFCLIKVKKPGRRGRRQ